MAIYPYKTEKLIDFSIRQNVEAYEDAIISERLKLGRTYPVIIGGMKIYTSKTLDSMNPANHKEIVGKIHQAGLEEASHAMDVALEVFKTWSKVDSKVRADILFKAAAIYRRQRFNLSALLTIEAGKPWVEADADIAEAIDFLEYYGRQILKLNHADDDILSIPDYERNEFKYIPLGVGAIITPWNFPLAILTGMVTAAVVSGNTVLLKPSSNTSVIAYRFMELMKEAGLPDGVINYIPGSGAIIGDYIVQHPKTRFISFTGSKEVGISIYEKAAVVQKGQVWLKRVIAEMGGKDAMLIDKDIDTNFAAEEIVKSAFGFSGQKCSACSRVIIHEDVYDEVVSKIVEKTNKLLTGDPTSFKNTVGPVIDNKSYSKIKEYLEIAKTEGKIVVGGTYNDEVGFFIDPTVVIDLSPTSRIMQEEIFGPVLGITKVKDFDEGIMVANNTEYGLTGGVISNNKMNLEKAREEFHVGNLYLNRKCTGAIVGYQPFGGFNMSGTDSKAGGPDYLIQHMQGKSTSERF
jgi:1-pyrroline-5-carboxylate dehydrogenase